MCIYYIPEEGNAFNNKTDIEVLTLKILWSSWMRRSKHILFFTLSFASYSVLLFDQRDKNANDAQGTVRACPPLWPLWQNWALRASVWAGPLRNSIRSGGIFTPLGGTYLASFFYNWNGYQIGMVRKIVPSTPVITMKMFGLIGKRLESPSLPGSCAIIDWNILMQLQISHF